MWNPFFLEDVYPRYRVHNKVVFCSLIFEELPSSLIPESAQMKTKNLNDNDDTYFPCTILVCIIRNYIIKWSFCCVLVFNGLSKCFTYIQVYSKYNQLSSIKIWFVIPILSGMVFIYSGSHELRNWPDFFTYLFLNSCRISRKILGRTKEKKNLKSNS